MGGHRWHLLLLAFLAASCTPGPPAPETVLLIKHSVRRSGPALTQLFRAFEAEHPGVRVVEEILPGDTDTQFLYHTVNLAAGSREPDLMALDVIWLPAFARAGWLRDLSAEVPESFVEDFFPTYLEADRWQGGLYALPWFLDGGVLYYRRDLLRRHGLEVPRTWEGLVAAVRTVLPREARALQGFLWQGKQYEGLVCSALEVIRGNGGRVLGPRGELRLTEPAVVRAVAFLRELVETGVSPPSVLSAAETECLEAFRAGRALFMRNWPYAWRLLLAPASPVRGKVGVAPVPAFRGHRSVPTLGGWHLAINRRSRHPRLALALLKHLLRPRALERFAAATGRLPPRPSLYRDPRFRRQHPELTRLGLLVAEARARPTSPHYQELSSALQIALSRALTGRLSPSAALREAAHRLERIGHEP